MSTISDPLRTAPEPSNPGAVRSMRLAGVPNPATTISATRWVPPVGLNTICVISIRMTSCNF